MTITVSTIFNDFALEEKSVGHLTQMGYHLVRRMVGIEPWQSNESFAADLIVTDLASMTGDRVIVIPPEAIRWSIDGFIEHLHRTLYRNWQRFSGIQEKFLALGSAAVRSESEDLVELLIKMRAIESGERSFANFHEGDLTLALMPTRRSIEIDRIMRIQNAGRAIFLLKEGRAELAGAESFLEYQRRIHPSLKLCFITIPTSEPQRRRFIKGAQLLLHPFPVFSIGMNALRALKARGHIAGARPLSSLQIQRLRIKELAKWLGSTRGDQEQSHSQANIVR